MSELLVFPRVKPLGSSSSSRRSVRKDATFPTEVIDYLKLNIYKHQTGRGQKADYGSGRADQSLYLYLPPGLNERYSAKYEGKNLGAVGAAVIDAAGDALGNGLWQSKDGGDTWNKVFGGDTDNPSTFISEPDVVEIVDPSTNRTYNYGSADYGPPVPSEPIVANAVLGNPILGCSNFSNPAEIKDKIVIRYRFKIKN